jgi:hypothetical protein
MRDGIVTEATILPQGVPLRLAPVLRVITTDSTEALMLGQRRGDLSFRTRVIGSALRLVTPTVIMPDALSSRLATERGTVTIGGAREGGQLRVGAFGDEEILSLHAGSGWLLLAPTAGGLQASANALSALWAGIPLFAVSYWMGRRARRRARRAGDTTRMTGATGQVLIAMSLLVVLAVIGLAGISAAFGLSQPEVGVWIGTVMAIGLGLMVGASFALTHDTHVPGSMRPGSTTGELPATELRTGTV